MQKVIRKFFTFRIFVGVLVSITLLLVFKTWFFPGVIVGGDWIYYFPHLIKGMSFVSSWDIYNSGMGSNTLVTLWLESYMTGTAKLSLLIGWQLYERLFWFFPYVIFSFLSSLFLFRYFFKNNSFSVISSLLYTANTYSLMLVGGGQMGIALSYSIAPFGLLTFEYLLQRFTVRRVVLFAVCFSIVFLLDIRIAYIMVFMFSIRTIFFFLEAPKRISLLKISFLLCIVAAIVIGIHMFWLLPTLLTRGSAIQKVGDEYTSLRAVQFFSFGKFEDGFGLLQPNWPENIFGKVGFMKPEFLALPLLAFSTLLFIKTGKKTESEKKETITIIFFVLVGILGIFLAKGSNDPFGGIYLWMFEHIPGFIMFRDPTKWYLLIVLAYSMLIPFTVGKIYSWLKSKTKFSILNFQNLFVLFTIFYLFFLIRPAILGQLTGTFKQHTIPSDYIQLQQFINTQNSFSRSLWVPSVQRFGFYSQQHPAVDASLFFHVASSTGVMNMLKRPEAEELLQDSAVKYVIVPFDSEGEIFLTDRKYDNNVYQQTIQTLENISWLHEIPGFGKIRLFTVSFPKNHFWLYSGEGSVTYAYRNLTTYAVTVANVRKGDRLVFADTYDTFWQAFLPNKYTIPSSPYNRLNSFVLPENGSYTLTIMYRPQQWVNSGLLVSGITCFSLFIYFLYLQFARGRKNDKIMK